MAKKYTKFIWIPLSVVIVFILFCFSLMVAYFIYDVKNHANPETSQVVPDNRKTLTKEIVIDNFSKNGEWYQKTKLLESDLINYGRIEYNAFNDLNHKIELLQIPSDVMLISQSNSSIKWNNVEKIEIIKKTTQKLIELNGILFSGNDNSWSAITITDKVKKQIIEFPQFIKINDEINSYTIKSNFYNDDIFNNISSIRFNPDLDYHIDYFSSNAFINCQKFEENIIINLALNTSFSYHSFFNTNISTININYKSKKDSSEANISTKAFAINENLRSFNINILSNKTNLFIEENGYFANNQTTNISIDASNSPKSTVSISSNAVNINNASSNVSLNINSNECVIGSNAFKILASEINMNLISSGFSTNWNVNNNQFLQLNANQINITTDLSRSYFVNSGLSQEVIDNINYV